MDKEEYGKSGIYFTADLHIGHKNILRLSNRPFGDIDHHDDTIIDNYNSIVSSNDVCYILGDISWNQSYETYKSIFNRLNGKKFIILGNHDNKQNLIRCQKEGLIESVKESQILQIGNDRIFYHISLIVNGLGFTKVHTMFMDMFIVHFQIINKVQIVA